MHCLASHVTMLGPIGLFTAQYISFEYKQKASSNAYNKCIISYFYIPCDVPCKIQNVDVRTNVKPRW